MGVLYGFVSWENIFMVCFKDKSWSENENTMMTNAVSGAGYICLSLGLHTPVTGKSSVIC